jgi:hypothetical protein
MDSLDPILNDVIIISYKRNDDALFFLKLKKLSMLPLDGETLTENLF